MKRKRLLLPLLLVLAVWSGSLYAQTRREGVREEVLADWNKSSGLDCVYDMSPKAATPAPKGYKATYISHYGRHGSRYAYTAKAYKVPLKMLRKASKEDNLTPYGTYVLEQLEAFWKKAEYQVGDLTPLGWQQHQYISGTMVKSFPGVFGKGSKVDACSSGSNRAIVSMTSFCSGIAKSSPKTEVYAHQGMLDVQATRPNIDGNNPFRYKGPEIPFPYPESSAEYFTRRFPGYVNVLDRLFKDGEKAIGEKEPYDVFFYLYMFVAGMYSIPEEVQMDLKDFFTKEEYATLLETDAYERLREYKPYRTSCCSIVDDIIAKADSRLESGIRGVDARFGHDHVLMSLLMIMNIDNFDYEPENPDDLIFYFPTFRSPMGANLQFVFYTKKGAEPLVKLLLNGEEAKFGELDSVQGPYYSWSRLKEYLNSRTALFVTR